MFVFPLGVLHTPQPIISYFDFAAKIEISKGSCSDCQCVEKNWVDDVYERKKPSRTYMEKHTLCGDPTSPRFIWCIAQSNIKIAHSKA
jgi:hypothetical protein